MYIGNLVQGKVENVSYKSKKRRNVDKKDWIVFKNAHEPIIDIDTWEKVQMRFAGRGGVRTLYSTGTINIFSKKVYCTECGRAMARSNGYTKNHTYAYLRCKRKASNPVSCTNSGSIRYDYLEEVLLEELNKLIAKYKDHDTVKGSLESKLDIENERKKRLKELNAEREKLSIMVAKKKGTLKSIYQDKEDGIITTEEFLELKEGWREDLTTLNGKLEFTEEKIKALSREQEKKEDLDDIISKYDKIEKLDRVVIDTFVNAIYISPENKETKQRTIHIEWNI